MGYFRKLLSNLKDSSPLLTLSLTSVGILVTFIIGFNSFPQNTLPRFLQQSFLLLYLYILFALTLIILILCFLAPLVDSKKFNLLWAYLIDTNKSLNMHSVLFLISFIQLMCIGLVVIYSATASMALQQFGDTSYFLKKQLLWTAIGIAMAVLLLCFRYSLLKKVALVIILSAVSLFALNFADINLIFFSNTNDISTLTSSFVMSYFNLAKISFIVYVASFLGEDRVRPILSMPLFVLLIVVSFVQNISYTGFSLFLVAGVSLLLFRINRRMFIHLWLAILLGAYLVSIVFLLLESRSIGGIFGVGLGRGSAQLSSSSYIIETVIEELGFLGSSLLLTLFIIYLLGAIRIALKSRDPFGGMLISGIAVTIGLQVLVHVWGFLGLFPLHILPLPFISYEGPDVLTNVLLTAIILNISMSEARHIKLSASSSIGDITA